MKLLVLWLLTSINFDRKFIENVLLVQWTKNRKQQTLLFSILIIFFLLHLSIKTYTFLMSKLYARNPHHLRSVIFASLNLRADCVFSSSSFRVCAHLSKFVAVCFGLLLSSRILYWCWGESVERKKKKKEYHQTEIIARAGKTATDGLKERIYWKSSVETRMAQTVHSKGNLSDFAWFIGILIQWVIDWST